MVSVQIKFMQWNCRALQSNYCELFKFLNSSLPVVIDLQEVNFTRGPVPIPGYQFPPIYKSRPHPLKGEGVAIYVKDELTVTEVFHHLHPDIEVIIAKITLTSGKKLKIANIYISSLSKYNTLATHDLTSVFLSANLILGDFNAKTPLWDREKSKADKGGRMLEEAMDISYMCLLNNGQPTHVYCQGDTDSTLAIDLSVCTAEMANILK